jgi:hypothetical protein
VTNEEREECDSENETSSESEFMEEGSDMDYIPEANNSESPWDHVLITLSRNGDNDARACCEWCVTTKQLSYVEKKKIRVQTICQKCQVYLHDYCWKYYHQSKFPY